MNFLMKDMLFLQNLKLVSAIFRWGTHLYMSLFPSIHLSVHPFNCHAPCLRNCTSSDNYFWEFLVKGQKISQNDKKFCLCHPVSQEPHMYCDFWYTCKMMISHKIFIFFKIMILRFFRGKRAKNDLKLTTSVCSALYLRNCVDHGIKIS